MNMLYIRLGEQQLRQFNLIEQCNQVIFTEGLRCLR